MWLRLPDGGDDVTGPLDDVGGDARPHHRLHRLALFAAARAHLHIHTKNNDVENDSGFSVLYLSICTGEAGCLCVLHGFRNKQSSVGDPDPDIFGPPGSASVSQRYGSG
jgi:hypothetical protein